MNHLSELGGRGFTGGIAQAFKSTPGRQTIQEG
jgi:hypothetical protein